MRFRKKWARSYPRRRLMAKPKRQSLPLHLCNFDVHVGTVPTGGPAPTWLDVCGFLETDETGEPIWTATVILDGGQFSQLGNDVMGMTKGLRFGRLHAQYDFKIDGLSGADTLVTLVHGICKVKMFLNPSFGRIPVAIPNLFSKSDLENGHDVLWRRMDRYLVPASVSGISNGLAVASAGTVGNFDITVTGTPARHAVAPIVRSNTMSVVSPRNLHEDEALIWLQMGYIYNVNSGLINPQAQNIAATLYGRMTVGNWQT